MKKFNIFIFLICFVFMFSFIGCEDKKNKSLSVPSNISFEEENIIFSSVSDAEYYIISINDVEITVDPEHNSNVSVVDGKIIYDASKIFIYGENYNIKVQACSSERKDSNFSPSFAYRYAVALATPKNVKINSTTLTWDTVENATYYVVKVITPHDEIILDNANQLVVGDDVESIKNAQLTENVFKSNQFNFSSILSKAGNYKFYVKAVNLEDGELNESSYSEKTTFTYNLKLSTPENFGIKKIETGSASELHLYSSVDENSTYLSVKYAEIEKSIQIESQNRGISYVETNVKNYLDINLNEVFKDEDVDFSKTGEYVFQTKVSAVANSTDESYYYDSDYSTEIVYNEIKELNAPNLVVEYDSQNNCFVAKLDAVDNATGYKIYVGDENGFSTYYFSNSNSNLLLKNDFLFVSAQSIGSGNYKNSKILQPISKYSSKIANLDASSNNLDLSWENNADYYILDINNSYYQLDEELAIVGDKVVYEIPEEIVNQNRFNVNLLGIKNGKEVAYSTMDISASIVLDSPTYSENQGFSTTDQYMYSFGSVGNAIGYYVYIKNPDTTEFRRIDKLYTLTTIDLSQYMESVGKYEIKVQAVAGVNSKYINSEIENATSKSFDKILTLEKPTFYKVGGKDYPVVKSVVGDTTKYYLWFYGVDGANSYEVLVNNNLITVPNDVTVKDSLYKIEITNFLTTAKNYLITVRAIADPSQNEISSSDIISYDYALLMQLSSVQNIQVNIKEGKYSLTFNAVDNAESYNVEIVKFNDENYKSTLEKKNLSPVFNIPASYSSFDLTDYVESNGSYVVYMTAIAKSGGYYSNSNISNNFKYTDESGTEFNTINKLTSLKAPKFGDDLEDCFQSVNKNTCNLIWTGDENADYYLIKITDPAGYTYEFTQTATTKNISDYLTIQGEYKVSIYSKIDVNSENASAYVSSSNSDISINYVYRYLWDFERYKVYIYGNEIDFLITSAEELKNALWYDLLYSSQTNNQFKIYLDLGESTVTQSLNKLIEEVGSKYYNFDKDETWYKIDEVSGDESGIKLSSDNEKMRYICVKLLELYPDLLDLSDVNLSRSDTQSPVFELEFYNKLNTTKIASTDSNNTFKYNNFYSQNESLKIADYTNNITYLKPSARRRADFETENEKTGKVVLVSSTEQLLQAVLNDAKPKFYGESGVAKQVYENAKLVLSSIILDSMSETEKITAIFDWIEYALNFDNYSKSKTQYLNKWTAIDEDISNYGLREEYYLEGLFYHLLDSSVGNYDNEFYYGMKLGTENLYAKAFAFLCHMEGIDARIIYDLDKYANIENLKDVDDESISTNEKVINHIWNKVALKKDGETNWYEVDLTLSDNAMDENYKTATKYYSSHAYFMAQSPNDFNSNENLIYKDFKSLSSNSYNYYSNSSYSVSKLTLTRYYPSYNKSTALELSKYYDGNSTYDYILDAFIVGDYLMNMKNKTYDADAKGVTTGKSVVEINFAGLKDANGNIIAESYLNGTGNATISNDVRNVKENETRNLLLVKNCIVNVVGNVVILMFSK